ncbi:MAG: hypothetical protein AB1938_20990 [Myxococcota bacterium]
MKRAVIAVGLAVTGCATSSPFYPLSELQALDPTEDRAEVLARAPEVAPSQRTADWRTAVEKAAIATLTQAEVKDVATAEQALALIDTQPQKFPFLARSPEWLARRADLGVKALPWLANEGERGHWPRRVYEFAKKDAVTPHLAQRLADEVLLKQLIASTAYHLAELAFEREGAAACEWPTAIKMTLELAADGSSFKPAMETAGTTDDRGRREVGDADREAEAVRGHERARRRARGAARLRRVTPLH